MRLTLHDTKQFESAKYYRLAEKNGNKIIGNTWYVDGSLSLFLHEGETSSLWTISERSPPSPLETPPTTLSPQLSPVEGRRLQHQFVWKSRMPAAAYDLRPPCA